MASARTPDADSVFVNCPFDTGFQPMFEALVFTILACGFRPRTAKEEADSGDTRLDKIARLIGGCRYGIHDISRVELDPASGLPRFNMPFELGIDIGCRSFGTPGQRQKRLLVLDAQRYRYQVALSDIAGQDIRSHEDDPDRMVETIRDWLRTASNRQGLPGPSTIKDQYVRFKAQLPAMCDAAGHDPSALNYLDYLGFAEVWLRQDVEAP